MKKFFNDPVLVILIIACIIVLAVNISVEAKGKEFRNDCGRFKVKNNGEFVTYADSVFELKGGGVVYFDGQRAGHSFGDVAITRIDCAQRAKK
jgi:hypothetical protein